MGLYEEEPVELDDPPVFALGQKVMARKYVKNDGTFPGREIGDVLVNKGEIGLVTSIGTFLQRFYIYGVDYYESGHIVGMRGKELEAAGPAPDWDDDED